MPACFDLVTVDARDSVAVAAFWSAALDLHEVQREDAPDGPGRWIVLADAAGLRRLGVQHIADLKPTSTPLTGPGKPRWHLDVVCRLEEIDTEIIRLSGLGGRVIRPVRREEYGAIAAMADPEGNVFDICAYGPSGE